MIRNFTPHVINTPTAALPSMGIARVEMARVIVGEVEGVPITRSASGAVSGLPAQEAGIFLIVSRIVAAALPERRDLLFPDELLRDAAGRVVGCTSFGSVAGLPKAEQTQ